MKHETPPALTNIRISAPKLSPKLRKLADFIQSHPNDTIAMSVDDLTANSGVSVATIYRFCREMGYRTFSHLKLEIAREIETESSPIEISETASSIVATRYNEFRRSLEDTGRMLAQSDIEAVADLVMRSRRILIVGIATSGVAASFLHYKLLRAGIASHRPADMQIGAMLATRLNQQDLLIAFSASGDTRDVIDLTKAARLARANVVAITSGRKNPVADNAQMNLVAVSTETLVSQGTGTSVVSQLAVADSIYETLYARNPVIRDRIEASTEAVISRSL